ncbi:HD domain-containing protein [Pseudomonas aeruginosa]|uniref:phosphonate degradation HD-domain oxygenase n=1 Tax=Pseudomonas aeruginosa TaxID=287 RepID=UPI000FD30148|nr:phosphonate degradation HD-domain oxygenase [Pseudomonas aeruginosa]MBW0967470.1 HD domain-containing protein [Pseudomonas aeruginosa]RUD86116.1 HD domain-containing protein [Pseudomonas aeruginosa]
MSRARHRFLDELAERFASHGAEPYGEAVSQAEHALQCATLAERAGCSDSLVVAALLHDIGHLYEDPAQIDEEDLRHEEFGARLLRELFPESVWQPVRLHVSAKRFLCAVDPSYHASLSPASRHSLVLQGGPFDERAAAAYIKAPYAQDGLTLRRLDDLAKDPAMRIPELTHFFPLLERLLRIDPDRAHLRPTG